LLIAATPAQRSGAITARAGERESASRSISDRPLDSALYSCRCGMVFDADVSANVRCPHCDGEQPW
jgi:predicted Zn-ribbon and HTH transcriptional regulator